MAADFEALGRYAHFRDEARAALLRRTGCLNNLAIDLRKAGDDNDPSFDPARYLPRLQEVADASAALRAAIEQANDAAARCGQRAISVGQLRLDLQRG